MKTVMIEDRRQMEAILLRCEVCYVGITDTDGNPYVVPMNFGYEDGVLYLHSAPDGSKMEMLERNNHVCITFSTGHQLAFRDEQMACSYSMTFDSVMCRGRVEFVEDTDMDAKRRALDIIMSHYTQRSFSYGDPAVRNVKIWKVPVEQMTGKSKH